jgi:hypothetical protein
MVGLLAGAVVMPLVLVLVLGLGRLLAAMGDAAGAMVLDRLALAGGLLWCVNLVLLLVALAVRSLEREE